MSSNDNTESGQPQVFGVPSSTVADALRNAGLDENAVVAVLGRAIARSAAATAAAAPAPGPVIKPGIEIPPVVINPGIFLLPEFQFQVNIAATAPECVLNYQRLFVHPDFIDGVTVVQAGQTPDEIGFNARFHAIEAEFDSISRDLHTSSNCVAELRRELYLLARELETKISEIDARLDAKGKDKDTKEGKETKEGKDTKDTKEKDTKEGKDKEGKDGKDTKDKDHKDKDKEHIDKAAAGIEKMVAIEAIPLRASAAEAPPARAAGPAAGSERTFITLDDRPDVQATALGDEPSTPAATPATPATAAEAAPAAGEKAAPAAKKAAARKAPAKKAAPRKTAATAEAPAEATPSKAAKAAPRKAAAAKKAAETPAKATGTAKKAAPRKTARG